MSLHRACYVCAQAVVEYFGTLSKEWALECLKELLISNQQQNLQLVRRLAHARHSTRGGRARAQALPRGRKRGALAD